MQVNLTGIPGSAAGSLPGASLERAIIPPAALRVGTSKRKVPIHISQLFRLLVSTWLTLLCSCATENSMQPALPTDVSISQHAGSRDGLVHIDLRLETGEQLPFVVDTGTEVTLFDKSLESRLGKSLGTIRMLDADNRVHASKVYPAPKLFLETTPLVTGGRVGICDHNGVGILGMDCLRHYCIQLDFETCTLRFLDPARLDPAQLGKAFPLRLRRHGSPFIRHGSLIGKQGTETLIDTGSDVDGSLTPQLLQLEVREHQGHFAMLADQGVLKGLYLGLATFPESVWDGKTYSNLVIASGRPNSIGLRFLARHKQVTFDFPHRIMYLKQLPNPNWNDSLFHEHQRQSIHEPHAD